MSSQHPDNVMAPFFAETAEMGGNDEVQEAYYSFSELGCTEQMWDFEGKEVDNFVVKKLYTRYQSYFSNNRLGEDLFLTLRVPNPNIDKTEGIILLETLESIPRSFDAANAFFDDCKPPVFEVILPMASRPGISTGYTGTTVTSSQVSRLYLSAHTISRSRTG
jgi:phosphoenolpyruvate carboxylase